MCFQLLFSFFFCNNDIDNEKDDDDTIYETYNDKSDDDSKNEKSCLNYYVRHNTFGIDLLR